MLIHRCPQDLQAKWILSPGKCDSTFLLNTLPVHPREFLPPPHFFLLVSPGCLEQKIWSIDQRNCTCTFTQVHFCGTEAEEVRSNALSCFFCSCAIGGTQHQLIRYERLLESWGLNEMMHINKIFCRSCQAILFKCLSHTFLEHNHLGLLIS